MYTFKMGVWQQDLSSLNTHTKTQKHTHIYTMLEALKVSRHTYIYIHIHTYMLVKIDMHIQK